MSSFKVFKARENATIPTKADGDMCYDLYASIDPNDPNVKVDVNGHYIEVPSRTVTKIPTGIKAAFPEGFHGSIRGRSGLAAKNGLFVLGGQIDNGYRGEIIALVSILSGFLTIRVYNGDKIAQLKPEEDVSFPVELVFNEEDLGETSRGEKGFGSSGMR